MENETATTNPTSIRDLLRETKRALKARELGDILSISEKTIYARAREGTIPSFRVGTAVRFDPKAVARWLDEVSIDPFPVRRAGRKG